MSDPSFRRLAELHREIADIYDTIGSEAPKAKRKPGLRSVPKFTVRPTELQRAKAASLLRDKGL